MLVFDLEGDRLLAVEAEVSGGGVRVRRAVQADRPPSAADDPGTIGRWIRGVLDDSSFRAKTAIFSVSRGEALIKRLEAPAATLSPAERHEMIRLQMARQASLTSADSVIDYVSMGEAGDDGAVSAAAMPAERVAWRREVAKAAGLKLAGIRLRSAGVRALLRRAQHDRGSTLVIAPGLGSLELLVIVGGRLVFSRSIDAPLPTTTEKRAIEHFAERVAVEASRTWVSYRVSPEGEEVERLVVLGAEPMARVLADAASERLELPGEVVTPGDLLDADGDIAPGVLTASIPLAGLLLCGAMKIPVLDFANPTAAPDTTAKLRQAVLAGVFALIVLTGAGYFFAQQKLDDERRALAAVRTAHDKAQGRYVEAQLAGARIGHMRAWTDRSIDWAGHLARVVSLMPPATESVLTKVGVECSHAVDFKSGAQLNDQAAWTSREGVAFAISGRVRQRDYAQAYRERLLETGLYAVESQGPEVEDRFAFQIVTGEATPDPPKPDAEDKTAEQPAKDASGGADTNEGGPG